MCLNTIIHSLDSVKNIRQLHSFCPPFKRFGQLFPECMAVVRHEESSFVFFVPLFACGVPLSFFFITIFLEELAYFFLVCIFFQKVSAHKVIIIVLMFDMHTHP